MPSDSPQFIRRDISNGRERKKKPRRAGSLRSEAALAKRRLSEKHIDEQLADIYGDQSGRVPDMKHLDKQSRHPLFRAVTVLFLSCIFLAGVAWIGFFVLQPSQKFSEDGITLAIAGDEHPMVGQEARYRIRYHNTQGIALDHVTLQVRYPDGFVFSTSSIPADNDSHDEWSLGTVGPDESGAIDLTGTMFGAAGGAQSFRVFFNYTPANFNSAFQKVTTLSTQFSDTPIAITLTAPDTVAAGGGADLVIHLAASSTNPVQNVAVEVGPKDFLIKKSSDTSSDPDQPLRFFFPTFSGIKDIHLKVTVSPSSTDQTTSLLTVNVRQWKDARRSDDGYVIATATHSMQFVKSDVASNLAINGSLTDAPAVPGDILHASVVVKNTGTSAIKNAVVRAIFDAPASGKSSLLKWSAIEDSANGDISGEALHTTTTRRGTIAWSSKQVSDLRTIAPGAEVTIEFQLPIKTNDDIDLTQFDASTIDASTEVQYDNSAGHQIVSGNPITLTVFSDTSLDVKDNVDQGSDGKEKHTVTWTIGNNFHALSAMSLTADVYGDVSWDTAALKVPAGKATFDPDKKKITWTIDHMPVGVDQLALQFAIILNKKNPTQTDLMSKVQMHVHDDGVNQDFVKVGDEIVLGQN